MGKKKLLAVMLTAVVATVGSSAGTMEVRAEEIVDIVMPMATLGEAPADLEKVEAKINEITEEKIGVHLVIEPIPFSDLSSQQNLMLSSGDQLDLVLSLWESGISNYVEKGAVIELTDLLDQYGKDILESVGSGVAGGYYSDALYAVPNAESQGHSYGFYARTDVIEELGFTFDIDSVYTIEDLEELFAAYKEKYGDGYYCVAGTSSTSDYFSSLAGHVDAMGNGNGGTGGYAVGALVDWWIVWIRKIRQFRIFMRQMHIWNMQKECMTGLKKGIIQRMRQRIQIQVRHRLHPEIILDSLMQQKQLLRYRFLPHAEQK